MQKDPSAQNCVVAQVRFPPFFFIFVLFYFSFISLTAVFCTTIARNISSRTLHSRVVLWFFIPLKYSVVHEWLPYCLLKGIRMKCRLLCSSFIQSSFKGAFWTTTHAYSISTTNRSCTNAHSLHFNFSYEATNSH